MPPGDFSVRELGDSDAEDVRALLVELALEDQGHYQEPWLTPERAEAATAPPRRQFVGENHIYVARGAGGEPLGVMWVVLYDPGTGLEAELAELYVRPTARRRGIGRSLCREAMRLFSSRAVSLASVWTHQDNLAAMALYRELGFSPTEHTVLTWLPGRRGGQRG